MVEGRELCPDYQVDDPSKFSLPTGRMDRMENDKGVKSCKEMPKFLERRNSGITRHNQALSAITIEI